MKCYRFHCYFNSIKLKSCGSSNKDLISTDSRQFSIEEGNLSREIITLFFISHYVFVTNFYLSIVYCLYTVMIDTIQLFNTNNLYTINDICTHLYGFKYFYQTPIFCKTTAHWLSG